MLAVHFALYIIGGIKHNILLWMWEGTKGVLGSCISARDMIPCKKASAARVDDLMTIKLTEKCGCPPRSKASEGFVHLLGIEAIIHPDGTPGIGLPGIRAAWSYWLGHPW